MKLTERTVQVVLWISLVGALMVGLLSFDANRYFREMLTAVADWRAQVLRAATELTALYNTQLAETENAPAPTPTPYVYHPPTQEQKNYALALGAILSQYNNENISTLKSNLLPAGLRQMMSEWWGITNRQSALETLDWLKREGHRTEYNSVYDVLVVGGVTTCAALPDADQSLCRDSDIKAVHDIAKQVHDQAGDKTLIAWDFGRLIDVTRWCYTMGWLSEEEAWTYIIPAAIEIQETYNSWEEFGRHYILGRAYWMRDMNANGAQENILKFLINEKNATPWTTISWEVEL